MIGKSSNCVLWESKVLLLLLSLSFRKLSTGVKGFNNSNIMMDFFGMYQLKAVICINNIDHLSYCDDNASIRWIINF